jgi:hypothetical protein
MHHSKPASLFDHLVGKRKQLIRYSQLERVGGLEVDEQLNFLWTAGQAN